MKITSTAFKNDQEIPLDFTCDGRGLIPPLNFSQIPQKCQSLALSVVDPDAPAGSFIHWFLWNIEPNVLSISHGNVPSGALIGTNSGGQIGYFPPCPHFGSHHYIFTVYALDNFINLPRGSSFSSFKQAINGHVLSQAELVGIYSR